LLPRDGGILSPWDSGHYARYLADLPVLASPFGTDGGEGAIEDTAAFFLEVDSRAAEKMLKKRNIRYVLLQYHPAITVTASSLFLGQATSPIRIDGDYFNGPSLRMKEAEFNRLVVSRLYMDIGTSSGGRYETLGGFRLVSEFGPRGGTAIWRLFQVVEGARVSIGGTRPGANVTVTTNLITPLGLLTWEDRQLADAAGVARFRLPYASGKQGRVTAGLYLVSDGVSSARLDVPDSAVEKGAEIMFRLDSH